METSESPEETPQKPPNKSDIPWITDVSPENPFFNKTDFSKRTITTSTNLEIIDEFLRHNISSPTLTSSSPHQISPHHASPHQISPPLLSSAEISYVMGQIPKEIEITLFENNDYNQNYVINKDGTLFIRDFFFRTLILTLRKEFVTFLIFHYISQQTDDEIFAKIITYTEQFADKFLTSRQRLMENDEDYQLIYELPYEHFPIFLLATTFTALIHSLKPFEEFTPLEKKQLSEIIFAKKIKRFLGIEEKSYQYIEKTSLLTQQCAPQEQEQFYALKELFEAQKKDFSTFINNELQHKKILFWCSWTISPFLAPDIGVFLNQLTQHRTIKKIYVDIPIECTETLQTYMAQKNLNNPIQERLLNQEIEKVYPIFIPDYAKETLPYTVFFENLKTLGISPQTIECMGFDGDELMMKRPEPTESEDALVFSIDKLWERKTYEALEQAQHLASDELIIFFYFLKPVYRFRPELLNHLGVARMLHVDTFTGFGPNKPINSLARYSKHGPNNLESFVFTDIATSPLANENIIFYPDSFQDTHLKLDDTSFNTFKLYDSILYSTSKGSGGQLETVAPKRNVHSSA